MAVKSSYLWVWDHALPSFTKRPRNSEQKMQKKQKRQMLYFDKNSTRQSFTFLRRLPSARVTPCPARETKIRRMLQQRERGGKKGRHQWKGNRLRAEQNRMGQARGLMGRMNADEQKHCSVASLHTSGQTCRDMNHRKKKKKNTSNTDITQNWVGGDLEAPNTFIFTCRLVKNKSCCIWFK